MKTVLASASLGRKKILTDLGLKFIVIPAKIDEREITASCRRHSLRRRTANPITLVKKIAKAKALTVSYQIPNTKYQLPVLIIAADSMVYFKGKTYGKPKDKAEARRMLSMLSGQTHEFITGICVICFRNNATMKQCNNGIILRSCKSRITFEKFTKKEIDDYVKIANVTSFAGGFASELKGGEIIKAKMKIKGSVSNVLGGLPLEILLPILKANGIKIQPQNKIEVQP